MVSYDYQIKTGEIIEILTTNIEGHGPSRSWLNIAKTNEAKSKIRSWFKKSAARKIYSRAKMRWSASFAAIICAFLKRT